MLPLLLSLLTIALGLVLANLPITTHPTYTISCHPSSPNDSPLSESCLATVHLIPANEKLCVPSNATKPLGYSLGDCGIELFDYTNTVNATTGLREEYCISGGLLHAVVERTVFACENRVTWVVRGELTDGAGKRGVRVGRKGVGGVKMGWPVGFWEERAAKANGNRTVVAGKGNGNVTATVGGGGGNSGKAGSGNTSMAGSRGNGNGIATGNSGKVNGTASGNRDQGSDMTVTGISGKEGIGKEIMNSLMMGNSGKVSEVGGTTSS
ncbi:hypothetical protein BJ508DRAFT_130910 [Ascobolus immersus RN42]|uniref:Cyanovirin-N domain-containing protein n=1 Tax=Ascobolus immersus RN42 TaxID=1160509 RepID=A0A3N4I3U3_ASCIM|nr:hypothetical protein BJ508DRAFT_130910 [Ascobolus immersus RN42]